MKQRELFTLAQPLVASRCKVTSWGGCVKKKKKIYIIWGSADLNSGTFSASLYWMARSSKGCTTADELFADVIGGEREITEQGLVVVGSGWVWVKKKDTQEMLACVCWNSAVVIICASRPSPLSSLSLSHSHFSFLLPSCTTKTRDAAMSRARAGGGDG